MHAQTTQPTLLNHGQGAQASRPAGPPLLPVPATHVLSAVSSEDSLSSRCWSNSPWSAAYASRISLAHSSR